MIFDLDDAMERSRGCLPLEETEGKLFPITHRACPSRPELHQFRKSSSTFWILWALQMYGGFGRQGLRAIDILFCLVVGVGGSWIFYRPLIIESAEKLKREKAEAAELLKAANLSSDKPS